MHISASCLFSLLFWGTPFISIHRELLHLLQQLYSIPLFVWTRIYWFICLIISLHQELFPSLYGGRILWFLLYLQQLEQCLIHSRLSINIHSMKCQLTTSFHTWLDELLGQGVYVVAILLASAILPSMGVRIIYSTTIHQDGNVPVSSHLCQDPC